MHQYCSHKVSTLTIPPITDSDSFDSESYSNSSFAEDSKAEYIDVTKLLIVTPSIGSNQPSTSKSPADIDEPFVEEIEESHLVDNIFTLHDLSSLKPSNRPWLTFDDIPKEK